jgi:hypothetical protein
LRQLRAGEDSEAQRMRGRMGGEKVLETCQHGQEIRRVPAGMDVEQTTGFGRQMGRLWERDMK